MIRQFELVDKVLSYDPKADVEALNKAYVYSMKAHGTQTRASGDPYFTHPLEVAGILTDLKLDTASIITALLHDTVEDTDVTLDDVEKNFGKEVAMLVDGVTKLSKLKWESKKAQQAENFRKFVLAMSEDIRVLLVKLADRLHNMRTLHHIKNEEKRVRIASETMEIYAPLAERIGLHKIKEELQELSFQYINPDARESIVTRLHFLRAQSNKLIQEIIKELEELMKEKGVDCKKITGREKSPYSIWRKMKKYNVSFEQITDIMAFRIIVPTVEDCYRVLGIVHEKYSMIPERFRDYISLPKPNGYKSLHTTVFGPNNVRIEIQIRTQEMHDIAENGVAAHWQYKQNLSAENRHYSWIRGLLEILEQSGGAEEFLEHSKLEMFHDNVFCFSPGGDLATLPIGATVLDFAYSIHSDIGNHCTGAKVNGKMVPLRTELKNGDQVEIITSKNQTPSPAWERIVVTGKAKSAIRRFIRLQQKAEYIKLGKSMLQKAYADEALEFNDKSFTKKTFLKKFKVDSVDNFYAQVGMGNISTTDVIKVTNPEHDFSLSSKEIPLESIGNDSAAGNEKKDAKRAKTNLCIDGLIPDIAVRFAKCCHPIPGDRIVGIVHTGQGVTVHTRDCSVLEQYSDEPERWLDVNWKGASEEGMMDESFVARLFVTLANKSGMLAELTSIIGQRGANIANMKFTNRSRDFFDIVVDVEVKNKDHLEDIIAQLRSSRNVSSVERLKH